MRIIAIRGQNLASLTAFEVNLAEEPLASTRIFSITGPTGSGKSTILDAMCLALYDRAPRFFGARDVPVGDAGLHGADPRSILRRGASEGRAEVDFVIKDGSAYRATWEVWRARKQSDGRIQNQRMRFASLTTESIAESTPESNAESSAESTPESAPASNTGFTTRFATRFTIGRDLTGATKTETLQEIESRVGLSFSEFTRAVLLAQGDFAAFLESPADQRAELLEKITGTELYGELSVRAFLRAKEEAERLKALEAAQQNMRPLTRDQRNALEGVRQERSREKASKVLERDQQKELFDWYLAKNTLENEHRAAESALQAAKGAWEASEALRHSLELADDVERLKPAFLAEQRAEVFWTLATQETGEADRASDEAERARSEAVHAASAAQKNLQNKLETIERMMPTVERVRVIDTKIAESQERHAIAVARLLERQKEREQSNTEKAQIERSLDELRQAKAEVDGWFSTKRSIEKAASEWPRWEDALQRLQSASLRAQETRLRQAHLEAELSRHQAQKRISDEALSVIASRQRDAQKALDEARAQLEHIRKRGSTPHVHEALGRLAEEMVSLDALKIICRDVVRIERQRRLEDRALRLATVSEKECLAKVRKSKARAQTTQKTLEERKKRLETLRAKNLLAHQRKSLLETGEPCPLCGSRAHPHKNLAPERDPAEKQVLRSLRRLEKRLETIRIELTKEDEARREHATAAAKAQTRKSELMKDVEGRLAEFHARKESFSLAWVDSPLLAAHGINKISLLLPIHPTAAGADKDLARAQDLLAALQRQLRERLEAEERALEVLDEAQTRLDATRKEFAARDAERNAERDAFTQREKDLSIQVAETETETKELARTIDALLEALTEPFGEYPNHRGELASDPASFWKKRSEEMALFQAQTEEQTRIAQRIETLEPRLNEQKTDLTHRRTAEQEAAAVVQEMSSSLQKLAEERGSLLGDRKVDDVVTELRLDRSQAEAAVQETQSKLRDVGERAARALERRLNAQRSLGSASEALEARRQELRQELEKSKVPDMEALRTLLTHGDEWIAENRAKVARLREEIHRCESVLSDRASRLEAHRRRASPEQSQEVIEERLATLTAAIDELLESIARVDAELSRDDAVQVEFARLTPRIEQQRHVFELWSEMNALIGSADGKKFRTFAQGLSLDYLISLANRQLTHLRPRYRLARVPGHDMELQVVDLDMAEEARAISTLSGGEMFLMSLALALGLSSMSSKNVAVESLFIDEGFGSLDPNALETALSVLDHLQAEGRTIGIISHVPDISDRIGYQVRVNPVAPGRSEVTVLGGEHPIEAA